MRRFGLKTRRLNKTMRRFQLENASIRSGNASLHGKERLIEKLCQGKDDGEISAKNAADARAVI